MIIEAKIVYDVQVLMPRARNPIEVAVRDVHPVQIAEVDAAILVAEIDADGWFEDESGKLPRHRVYMIDGEFWASTFLSDRGDTSRTIVTPELYRKAVDEKSDLAAMGVVGTRHERWNTKHFDSIEEIGAREILRNDRDKVCAMNDTIADGLRIADGLVLRRVSEPVYTIRWSSYRDTYSLYLRHQFLHEARGESRNTIEGIWRLDQYDLMMAHMQRVRTDSSPDCRPADLYRPDLLSWDRVGQAAIARFNLDLRNLYERHDGCRDMTVEQFAVFAALRDHGALPEDADDDAIMHAVDLARRMHAVLGKEELRYGGPFQYTIGTYEEMVEDRRRRAEDEASLVVPPL